MISRRAFGAGGAALAAMVTVWGESARAETETKILRSVPQAEPLVLDPHQSQANVTSVHAAMVYDTLFSWDAQMVPRPQMVESYSKSPDGLIYTFTLRPGLKF